MLGLDPFRQRKKLMQNICFIADVAVLPRWIKVTQLLDFMESTHPNFSRQRAEEMLARTKVRSNAKVRELSKGMVTQLHLSIITAIDAKLLELGGNAHWLHSRGGRLFTVSITPNDSSPIHTTNAA